MLQDRKASNLLIQSINNSLLFIDEKSTENCNLTLAGQLLEQTFHRKKRSRVCILPNVGLLKIHDEVKQPSHAGIGKPRDFRRCLAVVVAALIAIKTTFSLLLAWQQQ